MTHEQMAWATDDMRGAGEWDRRVYDLLTSHADAEVYLLARYRRLAQDPPSDAVGYLVRLIVEDEERHHRFMMEMANAIASGVEGRRQEPHVPGLPFQREDDDDLIAVTDALLAAEKRDLAELKQLARELKPVKDTTLWALLVDLMIADTEKHIRILKFVGDAAHRSG